MKKKIDWNTPMTKKNWLVLYVAAFVGTMAYGLWKLAIFYEWQPFKKKPEVAIDDEENERFFDDEN